jgi:hypothetical protein
MKPSDYLTKLHQTACALENDGQQISNNEVVYELVAAWDCLSVPHVLQVIRDLQKLKEELSEKEECLQEIIYDLNNFNEIVRRSGQ